jgi:hypothetical protein
MQEENKVPKRIHSGFNADAGSRAQGGNADSWRHCRVSSSNIVFCFYVIASLVLILSRQVCPLSEVKVAWVLICSKSSITAPQTRETLHVSFSQYNMQGKS